MAVGGLLLSGSLAQARTVKIITADTLEMRTVDDQEIVIIAGRNVELHVDDDVVKAQRVEFNRTRRTLTLVGHATYHMAKDNQNLTGDDLVVDVGSEALTGQDVLISDSSLEIIGSEIERVPGQLRATHSYFTPCARCGRTPNDYAFRAERVMLYPGDRLVAYRAQLLLADHPVLYLPVVVLPLNPQARQPRLSIGKDAIDGYVAGADLPFSIGSSVLGTTMLRYYQNRSPRLGGGVDLHDYAPNNWIDRLDLYALALPKPLPFTTGVGGTGSGSTGSGSPVTSGYDKDLRFSVKGRIPVELAVTDLTYSLRVNRKDIGRSPSDPEYGLTNADFTAKVEYPRFSATLFYLNRFGPEPTTALYYPLKKPEFDLDPKPFSVGPVSLDFDFKVGEYTAGSNPNSRQARAAGLNFTTSRLEEIHKIGYTRQLWKQAELQVTNDFTGHYYGTGARTVQLSAAAQLSQSWATTNSFTVRQDYIRNEGTSPFAFDVVSYTLSAPLSLNLSARPLPGATFNVKYLRDGFIPPGAGYRNEHLTVGSSVNRAPVNMSYALDYNWATGNVETSSVSFTAGDPDSGKLTYVSPTPAVPATPYSAAKPERAAYYRRTSAWPYPNLTLTTTSAYNRTSGGLQPITVKATVTDDIRTNYFSVSGTYDPQPATSVYSSSSTAVATTYSAVSSRDSVLNPVSISGNETLYLKTPRVTGNHSVTWRGYTLGMAHDLLLNQAPENKNSGSVTFNLGTEAGKATNWQLVYGGYYDMRRQGFTQPYLKGALTTTKPGQKLSTSATYNLVGLDQPRAELSAATMDAAWQQGRFSLSGHASYQRTRYGTYPKDVSNDTLTLDPVRVGVALGNGPKPGAYLTASLSQTFTYVNGQRQNRQPLGPVIGLTIDRCCWIMQGEIDLTRKRYRLAVGLPGQMYPLFQLNQDGPSVPLLPLNSPATSP